MSRAKTKGVGVRWCCAVIIAAATAGYPAHADESVKTFNIPARPLAEALAEFSRQCDVIVIAPSDVTNGKVSKPITGDMPPSKALEQLLQGTKLRFATEADGSIIVRGELTRTDRTDTGTRFAEANTLARNDGISTDAPSTTSRSTKSTEQIEEVAVAVPEILVTGSKSLNMDIRRTEDDAQPYVVLDKDTIERSGAINVEGFLKSRLTMNTNGLSKSDSPNQQLYGPVSTINLRGLGAGQTLILVDGRRLGSSTAQGRLELAQLNYIPLSIIGRIEVLPATASGIYGGGATGGVINIILRRDFSGTSVKLDYDNSFDSDSARRQVDLNHGSTFNDGRTQFLFAGSYAEQNLLAVGERDFYQRARARMLANNPASILGDNAFTGSTPNVQSADGSNLVLDNGTPLNSPVTFVPAGYAGLAAGDGGMALVANAGMKNIDLPALTYGGTKGFLQQTPTTESAWMTLRHELNSRLSLFIDAQGVRSDTTVPFTGWFGGLTRFTVPAGAATNPFTKAVVVAVPFSGPADGEAVTHRKNFGATIGGLFKLSQTWGASLDYSWSRDNTDFFSGPGPLFQGQAGTATAAIAAVNNGTLDVLQDTIARGVSLAPYSQPGFQYSSEPFRATSQIGTLRVSGSVPFLSLPAGAPTLTLLAEHSRLDADDGMLYSNGTTILYPERARSITSFYVEGQLPIVSQANARRGIQELQLQVAARYDETIVHGASNQTLSPVLGAESIRNTNKSAETNPTIAVQYKPVQALALRASAAQGFVPPLPDQLAPVVTSLAVVGSLVDPRRGGTPIVLPSSGFITQTSGGNPDLKSERSMSWSAGFVYTPPALPDLRVSLDYVHVKKEDNAAELENQQVIDNESVLTGRVTRGPNLPSDPAGWAGPIVGLDRSVVNIAQTEIDAVDVQLDYRFATQRAGTFDFSAMATWQPHYMTQVTPDSPLLERVGVTYNNPLEVKGYASLAWFKGPWRTAWTARYFDSFLVADPLSSSSGTLFRSQGARSVPSQVFHDIFAQYKFSGGSGELSSRWLDGLEIQAGVRNVFNTAPATYVGTSASNTGYVSPYGDTRLATYYLSMKYDF